MKTSGDAAQYQRIRNRLIICFLALSLGAAAFSWGASEEQLPSLRKQLATAEEGEDKPAIIELNRRIVAAAPNDSAAWQKIIEGQLEMEDYNRAGETLNAWQKAVKNAPAIIESFRGDVAVKLKDYPAAERHYRAFLARKPSKEDAADALESLADVCVEQQRIADAEGLLAKAIAAHDSPSRRVYHATVLLRLHRWDAAYAEMDKANKGDSTDAQVKEWLPQFERLAELLPRIKTLDAEIARKPNNVDLLLDRAFWFAQANRPLLALDDCQRAMKLDPSSVRARIQTGEALLDLHRDEEAAKLQVGRSLVRDVNNHVTDGALKALRDTDAVIAHDPNAAEPLAQRAKILSGLNQFVLASADAEAALAIDDDSASAHYEAAVALRGLERVREALPHAVKATELVTDNWWYWYYRGQLEADRTDYVSAIESQTQALKLRETLDALHEREKCQRRIGQVDKADADLRRIHELEPKA